ncbi:hypothetical protein ACQ4LE_007378 [Meloidogyne hapla]
MEELNNSNSLMSNNQLTTKNSSKFVLSNDQLDQLSNQLKLLSIDDVDIKKVLKKLKTLKNEQLSLANQAFIRSNGLFEFVLSQILVSGRVFSIDLGNNNRVLCRSPYLPKIKVMDQNLNYQQLYNVNNQKILLKCLDVKLKILDVDNDKKVTRKQMDKTQDQLDIVLRQVDLSNQHFYNGAGGGVGGGEGGVGAGGGVGVGEGGVGAGGGVGGGVGAGGGVGGYVNGGNGYNDVYFPYGNGFFRQ